MAIAATVSRLIRTGTLAVIGHFAAISAVAQSDCPTTNPASSEVRVPWEERHHLEHDLIWYGSRSLAVLLHPSGKWQGMGPDDGYANKLWLWSEDWDLRAEPNPAITVFARNLHDQSITSESDGATHGFAQYREAMLTGLGFPSPGCWEVFATYRNATVSFVVRVE